jgi:hypothetical protein
MKTPILLLDDTAQKFIIEHTHFIVISYRLAGDSARVWSLEIEPRAKKKKMIVVVINPTHVTTI